MAKASITVEGFVAKAPESRAAGSHTITSVTIPVEQGRMKNGEWVADTDQQGQKIVHWWEAEFWNEHGDVVAQTIGKGDLVTVTGEPRPRVYAKNDGSPGMSLSIVNAQIGVVVRRPSRQQGQGGGSGAGWHNPSPAQSSGVTGDSGFGSGFDSSPF